MSPSASTEFTPIIRTQLIDGKEYEVSFAPGEIYERADHLVDNLSDALTYVSHWLECLYPELESLSVMKSQDKLTSIFDQIDSRFEDIPDVDFTYAETISLQSELEKVKEELAEAIRSSKESEDEIQTTIIQMKTEIDRLKTQIDMLSQRNWYKKYGRSVVKWVQQHPTVAKRIVLATQFLLPAHLKHSVPIEAFDLLLLGSPTVSNDTSKSEPAATAEDN